MRLQMIRIPRGLTLPLIWQSHDQQKKKKKTTFGSVEMSKRSPKPEEDEVTEMNSQGHKIHESMVEMTGSHNPEVCLTQRHVGC